MMYSSSVMQGGHGIFALLHGVFSFLTLIGVFFLVVWAIKHLPAQKLRDVGMWLFSVGVVGILLLTALTVSAQIELGGNNGMMKRGMIRNGMMQGGMMWDDDR